MNSKAPGLGAKYIMNSMSSAAAGLIHYIGNADNEGPFGEDAEPRGQGTIWADESGPPCPPPLDSKQQAGWPRKAVYRSLLLLERKCA